MHQKTSSCVFKLLFIVCPMTIAFHKFCDSEIIGQKY